MNRISTLKTLFAMLMLMVSTMAWAGDVVYDFSKSIPNGWTASVAPNSFETIDLSRGAQFTANSKLTLSGATNVTKVVVECSANTDKNSIALSVGGTSWGTQTLAKENNVTKTFTGTAANGSIELAITRKEKSVYIKSITVTSDASDGGGGGGSDSGSGLDEGYTYAEPTVVTVSGAEGSNTAYSFIQNNIKVDVTAGAQNATYFGCNAGNSMTFTATKAIKGVVINGYVKKDFDATVSSGTIDYSDASEAEVEANPVVVIKDVNSKTLTIQCVKQLRCYSVKFYFENNPTEEVEDPSGGGDDGDYNYEYEPTTKTNLNITFDSMEYGDYSEDLGYDYTDMYFVSDDYEMELGIFLPAVSGTAVAPGTYQITDTYAPGTVQASPGGDDEYDYPTYIATGFEYDSDYGDYFYTKAYYLVSGTLKVENDPAGVKMTITGTTYYGSTVNATFVGAAVDVFADPDGIEDVEAKAADNNTIRKYVRNGHVVIAKGNRKFNVQGVEIIESK